MEQMNNEENLEIQQPGLSFSSVWSRSFSTFRQNMTVFVGLGLAAMLPSTLLEILWPDGGILSSFAIGLFTVLIQGAIAYAVYQILTGHGQATFFDSMAKGLSRFGTLVLASFLMNLAITLGSLFFLIPGLVLWCMYSVTIPVCVIEGLGATASMSRSANLTDDNRWTIFTLSICVILFYAFLIICTEVIITIINIPLIGFLLTAFVCAFPTAFLAIMYSIIYYDLRAIKEGVSIDSLAGVFD